MPKYQKQRRHGDHSFSPFQKNTSKKQIPTNFYVFPIEKIKDGTYYISPNNNLKESIKESFNAFISNHSLNKVYLIIPENEYNKIMTEKLSNKIFYNIDTLKRYFDIIISSQSNDSKERGNFLQFLQKNHFIRIFNPNNMTIEKLQDNNTTYNRIIDTIQKSQNNIIQLYKNIKCLMIPYNLLFDNTGNIKNTSVFSRADDNDLYIIIFDVKNTSIINHLKESYTKIYFDNNSISPADLLQGACEKFNLEKERDVLLLTNDILFYINATEHGIKSKLVNNTDDILRIINSIFS